MLITVVLLRSLQAYDTMIGLIFSFCDVFVLRLACPVTRLLVRVVENIRRKHQQSTKTE